MVVKLFGNYCYSSDDHIGAGMNCQVYRCYKKDDKKKLKPYAVKIFQKREMDKDDVECFSIENKILSHMNHKHIVKIDAVIESRENYYQVTEYCNGGTLEDILNEWGRFEELDAILILRQIVAAFLELFKNGIIHRDVKLTSILV